MCMWFFNFASLPTRIFSPTRISEWCDGVLTSPGWWYIEPGPALAISQSVSSGSNPSLVGVWATCAPEKNEPVAFTIFWAGNMLGKKMYFQLLSRIELSANLAFSFPYVSTVKPWSSCTCSHCKSSSPHDPGHPQISAKPPVIPTTNS